MLPMSKLKKRKVRLPQKPSSILQRAMEDFELIEADPRYKINMGKWHSPPNGSKFCQVCAAGAVMAITMKVPLSVDFSPDELQEDDCTIEDDGSIEHKLEFINEMRAGEFDQAIHCVAQFEKGDQDYSRKMNNAFFPVKDDQNYNQFGEDRDEVFPGSGKLDGFSRKKDRKDWKEQMAGIVGFLQAHGC